MACDESGVSSNYKVSRQRDSENNVSLTEIQKLTYSRSIKSKYKQFMSKFLIAGNIKSPALLMQNLPLFTAFL